MLLSLAVSLTQNNEFEESALLLNIIPKQYVEANPKYHFYNMVNAYKLRQDDVVEKEAEFFEDAYYFSQKIPTRYITVAALMKKDLETWKDNPVRQIDRKMKEASIRLAANKAGEKTQELQKQILDDLDNLIKQKEQQIADAQAKQQKEQKEKEEARQKQDNNIQTPAQDSYLPTGKAGGEIDMKKFKEYASVWGKLQAKDRAKAMQELTRNLPPKYKQAIEAYFKRLELDNYKRRK